MATKADNIFVRAKAYVKAHPRTSFQDAIQKVKGKKVSGVKMTGVKMNAAAVGSVKRKTKRPAAKVGKTAQRRTPVLSKGDKNTQLLALGKVIKNRIAAKEAELKKVKDKDERRLLIGFINGEHDKLDHVIAQMKGGARAARR